MGKAYSLDLRQRIAAHVAAGGTRRGAARQFAVSPSTAVRVLENQLQRGTLEPLKQGRRPGSGKLAPYIDFLMEIVEAVPDITMPELAAALLAEHGVEAHPSSLSRVLVKQGMTYKKRHSTLRNASGRMSAGHGVSGQASASRACARSRTG